MEEKFNKKNCGECRYMGNAKETGLCEKRHICLYPEERPVCTLFEQIVVTNGDVIRQGENRKLAEIFDNLYNGNKCKYCIHRTRSGACELNPTPYSDVGYIDAEDCLNGFEAWLNAPAESEVKNEETAIFQTEEKGEVE